ncbi:MAG: HEPN domain-containing protein [Crocinitomix sp.]|nr:HEPN domain-containing protein [Crocinitomix sp.]
MIKFEILKEQMTDLAQILSHLPAERVADLEFIRDKIVATHRVDFIVLFGSYARGDYKEERGAEQGKKSDFDILVVTEDKERRKQVISKLRNAFRDMEIPVQLVVEKITTVNHALEEHQYFYTDIKREGIELYNSGRYDFAAFKELSATRRREIAEGDFKYWYKAATEFYIDQKNAVDRGNAHLASFYLQQSVEMCYTAIEMVFSHYNPHEHNLQILRDRTLKFDARLKAAFFYDTEEEKALFDQLNFAYIGGRYRNEEEFPVTQAKIDFWKRETEAFLILTEEICLERIGEFKSLEG